MLDDLYKFFEKQNKDFSFNAKDMDGRQFSIGMRADMIFDEENDENDLLPVHLQACHSGENLNKCNITDDDMEKALSSLNDKPILGYIYKDDDGEYQFRSHDMHKENGETVYDEIPVGHLPTECNAHMKFDEEKKKNYVEVDGYIYEKYTKAADILRREGKCNVSVEMEVNEMSYNAKTHILDITDFTFSGVTILGRFEDGTEVQPGMAGSNITIRNSEVSFEEHEAKLEELARQIAEIQQSLSINNSEKGGTDSLMKFDELLKKYNKTAEEVTFETEGLSDEELEAKFAEAFGEAPAEGEAADPEENADPAPEGETPAEDDAAAEGEESEKKPEEGEEAGTPAPEEGEAAPVEGTPVPETPAANITASIKTGDKVTNFGLSLDEKAYAIHELVNATYADADNDYYFTECFEDDGYVIMQSWCTGRAFKQNIERNGDDYSLVGDRVEVFSVWVTEDEKKQLESMKNSYDSMVTKIQNYESEPEKIEVLNKEKYNYVREDEEFAKLMTTENHLNMSVDEVTAKADSILLNAAESGSLKFAQQNVQTTRKAIQFKDKNKGSGRYGNMFSRK
jgi:hypothetical protein